MKSRRIAILLLMMGNFFSSLAGGLALAKGLDLLSSSTYAFADSLLAYLIGSFLAFAAILYLRYRGGSPIWIFSASTLLLSQGLAPLFDPGALATEASYLFFFLLLCTFFSSTFISRALRSDIAASHARALTLVELAYSSGYLCGLAATRFPILPKEIILVGLVVAFLADFAFAFVDIEAEPVANDSSNVKLPIMSGSFAPGVLLFFAMTAGVQIGTQRLASLTDSIGPLAAFEIGVTLAPVLCLWAALEFDSAVALSQVHILSGRCPRWNVSLGHAVIALIVVTTCGMALSEHHVFSLVLLTLAACAYEGLSLLLLQWLGRTAPGAVSTAFAINGLLCSLFYALLLQTSGAPIVIALVTGTSAALAALSLRKQPIFS